MAKQFKTLYCKYSNCPPTEFEDRTFRACLYGRAKLMEPVIRLVRSRFFAEDYSFIEALGGAKNLQDVRVALSNFRDAEQMGGFFRRRLKLRVSGRKAARLAQGLFAEDAGREAPAGGTLEHARA
jgi:hypothetical protein